MFKNLFPHKIILLSNKVIFNLLILTLSLIFAGLIYSLYISPPDYIQGDSVRIMYVHVPSSFISIGCFALIGLLSVLNLTFQYQLRGGRVWVGSCVTLFLIICSESELLIMSYFNFTKITLVLMVYTLCSSY